MAKVQNGKLVMVRVCPHTLTWTATSKMLSTHYVGPITKSNGSDFGGPFLRRELSEKARASANVGPNFTGHNKL